MTEREQWVIWFKDAWGVPTKFTALGETPREALDYVTSRIGKQHILKIDLFK